MHQSNVLRGLPMSEYVTRVRLWFNSEGANPGVVIRKLTELGFTPIRGVYDFVYEHSPEDVTDSNLSSAIVEIANALHRALAGFKVLYTLDTDHRDEIDDYLPLEAIDAELEATRKELHAIENDK
jgi:hypothetical protein